MGLAAKLGGGGDDAEAMAGRGAVGEAQLTAVAEVVEQAVVGGRGRGDPAFEGGQKRSAGRLVVGERGDVVEAEAFGEQLVHARERETDIEVEGGAADEDGASHGIQLPSVASRPIDRGFGLPFQTSSAPPATSHTLGSCVP